MEECMRNASTWTDLLGFDSSSRLYVDMSKDLEDQNYLHKQMETFQKQLQYKGIHPLQDNLCSYFTFQCYCQENYSLSKILH